MTAMTMNVEELIQQFEGAVEQSKMDGGSAVHVGPFILSELVEIVAALKYKNPLKTRAAVGDRPDDATDAPLS